MDAARNALASSPGTDRRELSKLDLAVRAVRLSQALELVAAEQVVLARELDDVTWEDVGRAFGISTQSAHSRFRVRDE